MRRTMTGLVLAAAVTAAGCASGGAAAPAGGATAGAPNMEVTVPVSMRQRRDLLTQAQIEATRQKDAYSVVESLRSSWLSEKVRDTLKGTPTKVQVYLDDTRLGGVETLKGIAASTITYIQHFDGNAASARWGIGHGQGVIFVSTHPLADQRP